MARSDLDFALVEIIDGGGDDEALATSLAGKTGQTVEWLPEEEKYLVKTFDGEELSVAPARLRPYAAPPPEAGGFDLVFPASQERSEDFTSDLLNVLSKKSYCVVQMSSTPQLRKNAVNEAEDAAEWIRLAADFEMAFIGRRPKGKKLQWASDDASDSATGTTAAVTSLNSVGAAVVAITPGLGFFSSEMTNVLMTASCSTDEEQTLLEKMEKDEKKVVDGKEVRDFVGFSSRRKICMMYFVSGSGGTLTFHPRAKSSSDVEIPCNENNLVVFQNDLMDFTFAPSGKQLAMQAWILRDKFENEGGCFRDSFDEEVLEAIDNIPAGPIYGDGSETTDIMALAIRGSGEVWSPENYWTVFNAGTDCGIHCPHERWDNDMYFSDEAFSPPGKCYSKHYGMTNMEQMGHFDCDFFGYSQDECMVIDPPARVACEVGYECLHRGGWTKETLKGQDLTMVGGYAESEYTQRFTLAGMWGVRPDARTLSLACAAACRMHYAFGTTGPVGTVETACSSGLTATCCVHAKMRGHSGDALAQTSFKRYIYGLAWAANGYFDPFTTIGFCGAAMLGHYGRCLTFDTTADGYMRAEAQGALYMKISMKEDFARLAMMCGSCMNQDGRSASLTAPHGPSQQECIRSCLREGNIQPLDIQFQELHGTGTALGDPIEVGALRATMMTYQGRTREKGLVKTSSKSNHGHGEISAGIVGIIKCVLLGMNAACAANLHLRILNPHIDSNGYPVYFTSEACDQGADTGYNGVSSFGFGGSNARGDVWGRAISGARNTDPKGWEMDMTATRVQRFYEVFWYDEPRCAEVSIAETNLADYEGDYLTGDPLDCPWLEETPDLFVEGSFNGWKKGQRMIQEEDSNEFNFAITLGDTRVEQFRFNINEYPDAAIFPMTKSTSSQETPVLGPGPAPAGQYWVIDGIADGASQGTVYKITFKYDKETRQKKVSWAPTTEEPMLAMAAESSFNGFKHSYSVVASWNRFVPMAMPPVINVAEPGTYQISVMIGNTGHEEFYFLRDGQKSEAIYPASHKAKSGDVPVRGPDLYCEKKYFDVVGDTGDRVDIKLKVWEGEVGVSITSIQMGTATFNSDNSISGKRFFVKTDDPLPLAMKSVSDDGTVYRAETFIPQNSDGCMNFQILVDENLLRAIHPEMPGADQGVTAALGPDSQGEGLNWAIFSEPGAFVTITLDLSKEDPRQIVTWEVAMSHPSVEAAG
mmetsp:Transcript_5295/g.12005  ORF Transcript_5295/g.12005 Transcript_5295/m.12005 type:complete len:1212 (-) Transcript_5295:181-3816(-)